MTDKRITNEFSKTAQGNCQRNKYDSLWSESWTFVKSKAKKLSIWSKDQEQKTNINWNVPNEFLKDKTTETLMKYYTFLNSLILIQVIDLFC